MSRAGQFLFPDQPSQHPLLVEQFSHQRSSKLPVRVKIGIKYLQKNNLHLGLCRIVKAQHRWTRRNLPVIGGLLPEAALFAHGDLTHLEHTWRKPSEGLQCSEVFT